MPVSQLSHNVSEFCVYKKQQIKIIISFEINFDDYQRKSKKYNFNNNNYDNFSNAS